MSTRGEKRARAARHDSRRWLKHHPPKQSDPLTGLKPTIQWREAVDKTLRLYPIGKAHREMGLRGGGVTPGRCGPSAERVVLWHSGGYEGAVDAALEQFKPRERRHLAALLWGRARYRDGDRALVGQFRRYVAAFLGYGRECYDIKSS